MKKRLVLVLFSILIINIAGCGVNPTGVDNSVSDTSISDASVGMANLQIVLSSETVGSLRAAAIGTKSFIRIVLFIANPGSSTAPYTKMQKLIPLEGVTSVNTSFAAIPAKPVLVQVTLTDASIDNKRSFHGVADLVSETNNTITPVAIGANNASDTAAKVFTEFIQSPTLMQNATNTLVKTITDKIADVGNDAYLALNSIAADFNGFVSIASANSGNSLKVGSNLEVTSATFWGSSTTLKVQKIIRPGIGDFGYVSWQADDGSTSAISKVSTTNATNLSSCTNSGKLTQFVVLSDNSIIAGGYNSVKDCPVIFKWTPGANGNIDTGAGLNWVKYFTGLSDITSSSGPAIEQFIYNGENILLANLRKASDNSLIEFNLDAKTGNVNSKVGAIPGIETITAAYSSMESILQNNNLSSQQRIDGFMAYIADDFKDVAGSSNKKSELAATTLSRLERYIINSYSFSKGAFEIIDSTTIKVTTPSAINVTRKPNMSGAVSGFSTTLTPIITWKFYPSGWKIYQGLPYKSSEIGF